MTYFDKYNIKIYKGRFFFEFGWFPGMSLYERLFDISIFSPDGESFVIFNLSIFKFSFDFGFFK